MHNFSMRRYTYTDVSRIKSSFIIVSIAGLVVGFLLGNLSVKPEIQVFPASYISQASILLPAVDDQENGLVTPLKVEVKPGTRKVLTNIDKLLFLVDTQS